MYFWNKNWGTSNFPLIDGTKVIGVVNKFKIWDDVNDTFICFITELPLTTKSPLPKTLVPLIVLIFVPLTKVFCFKSKGRSYKE